MTGELVLFTLKLVIIQSYNWLKGYRGVPNLKYIPDYKNILMVRQAKL